MSAYTVNLYRDLRNQYPSWDTMKAFLTSNDGGKLAVKEGGKGPYVMIYAKKGVSDYSKPHVKWFRSVVWNSVTNLPVSVMTQKAEQDNPLEWSDMPAGYHISSYEDGVTLTAFRDVGATAAAAAVTQIASRSQFGAGGKFYKSATKTFAQMLDDAVHDSGCMSIEAILGDPSGDWCSNFCSILVQHPEHRVVKANTRAHMIVLQLGRVAKDGSVEISDKVPELPDECAVADGENMFNWFERISKGRDWSWQGVMISDMAGRRWRIRSPVYTMIRSLRGNTSRVDERFFGLRAVGLVKTYLIYYPEDSNTFWACEQWLRQATAELYKYYVGIHKAKTMHISAVPGQWQAHVSALHGTFLKQLRPAGKSVNMGVVMEYMNSLPTPRLLYLMNLRHRKAADQPLATEATQAVAAAEAADAVDATDAADATEATQPVDTI